MSVTLTSRITDQRLAEGEVRSTFAPNLPNLVTLTGYGLTIAWLLGGPWVLAVAGIAADELDGWLARRRGESTEYGSLLDWTVDVSLTSLSLMKLGVPWLLLIVTPLQVYMRETNWRPPVGSARAVFTGAALLATRLRTVPMVPAT